MIDYVFRGEIPASKSVLNRALIVADYFPNLMLSGDSNCDDVAHMKSGLLELSSRKPVQCGEGGTTFRFLALRASRIPGRHLLKGTSRLLSRPQKTLLNILEQLGVHAEMTAEGLVIDSKGWKNPVKPLVLSLSESSQFASGVFLNSWNLDFDLHFKVTDDSHSRSYLDLSIKMLQDLGMNFGDDVIQSGQRVQKKSYRVESDLSSAFSMAAVGALVGPVEMQNFPFTSKQPDLVFLDVLAKMGVETKKDSINLQVNKASALQPVHINLGQSPDLFPALSVLCAYAPGESRLDGAPQLVLKESNRIAKTQELLSKMNIKTEALADGLVIFGKSSHNNAEFTFDPDQDHRMAMAAGIAQLRGHKIKILNPECLNKSFPEFFSWTGVFV